MMQGQQLQQCIKDCQNVMNELQSLAGKAGDMKLKSTLMESAHHLHMCVHECEFASKQMP